MTECLIQSPDVQIARFVSCDGISRLLNMFDQTALEIIRTKPIGSGLDAFRNSFSSVAKELDVPASTEAFNHIGDKGNTFLLFHFCFY
jgi:hypothetical protein